MGAGRDRAAAGRAVRLRASTRCARRWRRRCSRQLLGRGIYVASAGVRKGELDPFAVAVMEEIGIDIAAHRPITFEELEDLEGLNFDLIVTLSPEAHHTRARADAHRAPSRSNTGRPPIRPCSEGNREQRLDAYRTVRDQLTARIRGRSRRRAAAMNDPACAVLRGAATKLSSQVRS